MIHIKLFEELNVGEPTNGDYVVCQNLDFDDDTNLTNYLPTVTGRITEIKSGFGVNSSYDYWVKFYQLPTRFSDSYGNPMPMSRGEITHWAKNRKELEYVIAANKYNL